MMFMTEYVRWWLFYRIITSSTFRKEMWCIHILPSVYNKYSYNWDYLELWGFGFLLVLLQILKDLT